MSFVPLHTVALTNHPCTSLTQGTNKSARHLRPTWTGLNPCNPPLVCPLARSVRPAALKQRACSRRAALNNGRALGGRPSLRAHVILCFGHARPQRRIRLAFSPTIMGAQQAQGEGDDLDCTHSRLRAYMRDRLSVCVRLSAIFCLLMSRIVLPARIEEPCRSDGAEGG